MKAGFFNRTKKEETTSTKRTYEEASFLELADKNKRMLHKIYEDYNRLVRDYNDYVFDESGYAWLTFQEVIDTIYTYGAQRDEKEQLENFWSDIALKYANEKLETWEDYVEKLMTDTEAQLALVTPTAEMLGWSQEKYENTYVPFSVFPAFYDPNIWGVPILTKDPAIGHFRENDRTGLEWLIESMCFSIYPQISKETFEGREDFVEVFGTYENYLEENAKYNICYYHEYFDRAWEQSLIEEYDYVQYGKIHCDPEDWLGKIKITTYVKADLENISHYLTIAIKSLQIAMKAQKTLEKEMTKNENGEIKCVADFKAYLEEKGY